jgi:ribosomal protein L37AE/L43A
MVIDSQLREAVNLSETTKVIIFNPIFWKRDEVSKVSVWSCEKCFRFINGVGYLEFH